MGCGVACVGSRCGLSYAHALALFAEPCNAWTRGYYCREIVAAFAKANLRYAFAIFDPDKHRVLLERPGTVVFHPRGAKYPEGHFFLRTSKGWMNPWSNFPRIDKSGGIKAKIQAELGLDPDYVIYELE